MFRCDKCKQVTKPYVPEYRHTTATKVVSGHVQIAHEEKLCPDCARSIEIEAMVAERFNPVIPESVT